MENFQNIKYNGDSGYCDMVIIRSDYLICFYLHNTQLPGKFSYIKSIFLGYINTNIYI